MACSLLKSCIGHHDQTQDANISATGDQVILVGAASKGIIQRGFQHNAMVYKTPYAKNPFDTITDEELEEYKKVVERKQKGESCKDIKQYASISGLLGEEWF
jgi:adducin